MTKDSIKEFFSNKVNHQITESPILVNLPHFNEDINEKRYIIKDSLPFKTNIKFSLIPSGLIVLCTIMIYINSVTNPYESFDPIVALIFNLFGFLISGLLIYYCYKIGDTIIEFNREHGTVTVPVGFMKNPKTFMFDNAKMYIGYGTAQLGGRHLGIKFRGIKRGYIIGGYCQENQGAFYAWYMDRNRPLPPGDRFNDFRKSDAKRLRDLGYPQPLYPMSKEVEELTKEFYQQALNADISDDPIYNGDPGTEPTHYSGLYIFRKSDDPGNGYAKLKPEGR